MNGIITVFALGKEFTLRFGMFGCMEFERRLWQNATSDTTKMLVDMIYGGMYGEAMRNEQPIPPYALACDILESLYELPKDEYVRIIKAIQETYESSRYGQEFIEKMAKVVEESKKVEQDGTKKKMKKK